LKLTPITRFAPSIKLYLRISKTDDLLIQNFTKAFEQFLAFLVFFKNHFGFFGPRKLVNFYLQKHAKAKGAVKTKIPFTGIFFHRL
jgi:hypothetical protein